MQKNGVEMLISSVREDVIAWRRYLHTNPELSFNEKSTSLFIEEKLRSFGNLEVSHPTENSVMARLVGLNPGKTLAIRADMDALEIQEENNFEYVSQNPGVMHACGHDAHSAILLGTAKVLSQLSHKINGEIRFLFQPAEEIYPGGAEAMVDAGVMEGVNSVIGAHVGVPLEVGKVGVVYGPMMASPDTFWITILGQGGHGASPHQTIDPVVIAAEVITNLQHIVARKVDPLDNVVVSVTQIAGGTAYNIIPGSVEMSGTVRSFDPELRTFLPSLIERIVKGITQAHGADYTFKYQFGYRPVINNDEITRIVENTAVEIFGVDAVERLRPAMIAEDFSAFLAKAPGTFFNIGVCNTKKGITFPLHHAHFTIDEEALEIGVKMFVYSTFELLK